ncbi:MAG: DNA repair protein RecN, partial [Acidimicrobiales bacterium]
LRAAGESIAEDPERLAAVRERRQRLHELRRKYGDTLEEVVAFRAEAGERLARLESHDERIAELENRRLAALDRVARRAAIVGRARRAAAPELAAAVQAHLVELAMAGARLAIEVGDDDPGDEVRFLLAASKGAPLLPLAKVASGGELARAMLALRLVLLDASPNGVTEVATLVFDEVDVGIGGRSALAVGRALALLGADRQVLVVTHLPQVAAFADRQLAIVRQEDGSGVWARAADLDPDGRLVELSRMLSGSPESSTAQEHAAELLATAARERSR